MGQMGEGEIFRISTSGLESKVTVWVMGRNVVKLGTCSMRLPYTIFSYTAVSNFTLLTGPFSPF